MGKLLRVEEAADRLGLRPATIRKLLYLKQLPCVRPTKRAVRIPEDAIEAIIKLGRNPRAEVRR